MAKRKKRSAKRQDDNRMPNLHLVPPSPAGVREALYNAYEADEPGYLDTEAPTPDGEWLRGIDGTPQPPVRREYPDEGPVYDNPEWTPAPDLPGDAPEGTDVSGQKMTTGQSSASDATSSASSDSSSGTKVYRQYAVAQPSEEFVVTAPSKGTVPANPDDVMPGIVTPPTPEEAKATLDNAWERKEEKNDEARRKMQRENREYFSSVLEDIEEQINAIKERAKKMREETPEQTQKRERLEKSRRIIAATLDGLGAIGNLALMNRANGAVNSHSGATTISSVEADIRRDAAERDALSKRREALFKQLRELSQTKSKTLKMAADYGVNLDKLRVQQQNADTRATRAQSQNALDGVRGAKYASDMEVNDAQISKFNAEAKYKEVQTGLLPGLTQSQIGKNNRLGQKSSSKRVKKQYDSDGNYKGEIEEFTTYDT